MKNDLEFLTNKEITRRDVLKIGFTTLGSLFVPSYLSSCGGGGSEDPAPSPSPNPNPQPQNNNPIINTSSLPDADEATSYAAQISASDPDNDVLTYNLTQKPNGMTNTGRDISWSNPATGDHNVNVEVLDGKGGSARKDYILKVINKFDDISGSVNDILNGNSVQGADVILGHRDNGNFVADYTVRTDLQGNYVHQRIPTGRNWLVKIVHANYNTHLAGSIQTTKDETGVDLELINKNDFDLMDDNNFFNEVARRAGRDINGNVLVGQTQKWLQVPQVYINTSPALGSGVQPTQQEINLVENIFRNELPRFNNGFTTSNITITKGTSPPANIDGLIVVTYRDNLGGLGAHGEHLNGNEIKSAEIFLNTGLTNSQQLGVYRQECTQVFGPRDDDDRSPFTPSIFNDPPTPGIDNYTQADLNLGKILYKRPIGNIGGVYDINGNLIRREADANPDSYRIR